MEKLNLAMDEIRERYGKDAVVRGSMMKRDATVGWDKEKQDGENSR